MSSPVLLSIEEDIKQLDTTRTNMYQPDDIFLWDGLHKISATITGCESNNPFVLAKR